MAIGRTNAGGGGFNKSVIIVTAPTGSTVTCTKGTTVKTATEKNGEWWFKNLDTGEWTLKATLSGQTATQTVNITQFGVYRVTMSYFKATIRVTYPVGSICTCSKGDEVLTAGSTSGVKTFTVTSAGTWTVKATDGSRTVSESVSITASGESKSVILAYTQDLYNQGNTYEDVTGGWKAYYPNVKFNSDNITIDIISSETYAGSGVAGTINKVDITGYKTLNIQIDSVEVAGRNFALRIMDTQSYDDSYIAQTLCGQTGIHSLDVQEVNKEVYIGFGGRKSSSQKMVISRIWME